MTRYILSYGGGVNSTALLLEWLRRGERLDAVIFADPGAERPETYTYIDDYIRPLCVERGIPYRVPRYITQEGEALDIYNGYAKNRALPAISVRTCTVKWKVRPIEKLVKVEYPGATQLIGIDYGELHRARFHDEDKLYPLIDWEWTRDDCAAAILAHGWPVPVKSGCYFCPFQRREQWRKLHDNHPALYAKAEELEGNCRRFPEFGLMQTLPKRLDWFRRAIETQTTLDTFSDSERGVEVHCGCYDG